ncbi:MAG: polysaccharide synthesis protein exod [Ponticaulis sp.]|nr:polysaccharide synthesis protein exod [Ponticaulis sp.]|tara:strand:- start:3892 stop:4533 length:642 start_codon:yes stop_codon:yes gene_type:complete
MTDTAHPEDPQGSILSVLDRLANTAPPEGLTLKQLFDALHERAFGAILFALALPCCIPFLYAVPQIVSLPMAAIAFQMVLGRREPWLPGKFADRRIDKAGLERIAKSGRRFFGWAEAIARRRLTFMASRIMERFVGLLLCLFCGSILVPLPLTNTVPGFAVALVSFGLMARDGFMMIVGLILGLSWISFLFVLGPVALKELIKAGLGIMGVGV